MDKSDQQTFTTDKRLLFAAILFGIGQVAIGAWRMTIIATGDSADSGSGPTIAFVVWTVAFLSLLARLDPGMDRFGFRAPVDLLRIAALAILGVILIQLSGLYLEPFLETLFGSGRDLSRFQETITTPDALATILLFSWAFAAFGEEITFRILLMQSLQRALANMPHISLIALTLQSVVFGLVHMYQGPVGIIGAGIAGFIFGALVLAARGCIWPAVLAHGISNSISLIQLYSPS